MAVAYDLVRPATYEDLEALPPGVKGEIIDGTLYTQTRPRARHANVGGALFSDVYGPFQRRRNGGPGGWWILPEPGIERLPRSPEFAPDIAGWRRARMPHLPPNNEPIRLVPDWICEILSPSTRRYDLEVKRPFYASIGVNHLWYVDVETRTLTVSRLQDGRWLELAVHAEDSKIGAEPFEAVELDMAAWWDDGGAEQPEP
jgi:Uma2 family endonuclease